MNDDADELVLAASGGKWEDEEERRFFEDIQDLREVVPKSILGVEDVKDEKEEKGEEEVERARKAEEEEVRKLEEELAGLKDKEHEVTKTNGINGDEAEAESDLDDGCVSRSSRVTS